MPTLDEIRQLLAAARTGQTPQDLGDISDQKPQETPPLEAPAQLPDLNLISSLKTQPIPPVVDSTPSVGETLNKLPTPQNSLSGYGQGLSDKDLVAAMQMQGQNQLLSNIGKAGETIGAAIANVKPKTEFYQDLEKQAGQPVENIMLRRKAADEELKRKVSNLELASAKEKMDPHSDVSKIYRDTLQKMGVQVSDTATASTIEKAFPAIEKYYQARETAESRKLLAGQKLSEQQEKELNNKFIKFGNELDTTRQRSGAAGDIQKKIYAAERLEGLLNQFPDGNIPAIQTRELSTSLAALLGSGSGNQTAVSQINELVPHTLRGKWAQIAEWYTNKPTGLGQQKFIQLFADTAAREKQIAQNQIKNAQLARIAPYEYLKEKDADRFQQVLASRNISPEDYEAYRSGTRTNNVPSNTVRVRRKSDGTEKTVAKDVAQKILQDPNFEEVK